MDGNQTSKRVLHVMRMRGVSGSENHLLELARSLRPLGWESDVLIPSPEPKKVAPLVASLADVCGRVTTLRMRADFSPRLVAWLARDLRSGRYDLAHAHLVHADWHLAIASLAAPRMPLVSTKHNADPFRRLRLFRAVEAATARRYSRVIAISESLREFNERWDGGPAVTIHYGLSAPEIPPERPRPGRAAGEARLLAVGRLERQKGFDLLVRAMASVRKQAPARLTLVGDGRDRPRLESLVRELSLEECVTLAGYRSDVPSLMRDADLFVHPARWEGFGLVLLEAMRESLPIVATAVGAIPEVVEDDVTARLVPPDDERALAQAIVQVLADTDFRRRAAEAGLRRLKERFSPETMAAAVAGVYGDAVT
jgi:glycosyltransferase involved in cell wall biosynthesis